MDLISGLRCAIFASVCLTVLSKCTKQEEPPECHVSPLALLKVRSRSPDPDPEPYTFYVAATSALRRSHETLGRYADEWFKTDVDFACRQGKDRSPPPRPENGARWRPDGCHHTYVIAHANEKRYLVQALDDDGRVVMQFTQDTRAPCVLADVRCADEEDLNADQEQYYFLARAQHVMALNRSRHGRYPASWEELIIVHWAIGPHTQHDPRAFPPRGSGAAWTPMGSRFTYLLKLVGPRHYEIRSVDETGRPGWAVTDEGKPFAVPGGYGNPGPSGDPFD